MRVGPDGRVTIPEDIREALALTPDAEGEFVRDANGVHLVRVDAAAPTTRGEQALAALRGTATSGLSADEILRMTRDR